MNEIFEFWSLPWHTLQRSLANGFGADAAKSAAPGSPSMDSRAAAPAAGASWLARARANVPPAPPTSRWTLV